MTLAVMAPPADEPEDKSFEWRELQTSKLKVPLIYQRDLDEPFVKRLVTEWRGWRCEALLVAFIDGQYYVVDGQHRLVAMRQLGIKTAMCRILYGFSTEEQAVEFIALQRDRRAMSALDLYRASIVACDSTTLSVEELLDKHGFQVSKATGPNRIRAVGTLQNIAKTTNGLRSLDLTLAVIRQAWDGGVPDFNKGATEGSTIAGISLFVRAYLADQSFSAARLTEVLRKRTPLDLVKQAKSVAIAQGFSMGGGSSTVVTYLWAILGWYNQNLSANRLPVPRDDGGRRLPRVGRDGE